MATRRVWVQLIIFCTGILVLGGCAHQATMIPRVERINVPRKLPAEVALLITPEVKDAVIRRRPSSLYGWAHVWEFPMGKALEEASVSIFSQVFQKVTVIRNAEEAKRSYGFYIEPTVEDFFFYNGYHWLWHAVYSRVRVRIVLSSGEKKIWEFALRSPTQRAEPATALEKFIWNNHVGDMVGESASKALTFCLQEIAKKMAEDIPLRQLIEGKTQVSEIQNREFRGYGVLSIRTS